MVMWSVGRGEHGKMLPLSSKTEGKWESVWGETERPGCPLLPTLPSVQSQISSKCILAIEDVGDAPPQGTHSSPFLGSTVEQESPVVIAVFQFHDLQTTGRPFL